MVSIYVAISKAAGVNHNILKISTQLQGALPFVHVALSCTGTLPIDNYKYTHIH